MSTDEIKPSKPRYYTRARVLRRLVLLVALYLFACAGIAWISVAPKHRHAGGTPRDYRLKYERIEFRSIDNAPLSGWYIPSAGQPKGIIILCHGVDGDKADMLPEAAMMHRHGYGAFVFDFRARGDSGGSHSTLGLRETDDLIAAVQEITARKDCNGLLVGVLGDSMGGAVALMATAHDRRIRAVVAESPYARLDHAVHNHFRKVFGGYSGVVEAPVRWFGERMIGSSAAAISPLNVIGLIAPRPVLLIEDSLDKVCPSSETHNLYAACGDPRTLWIVPGAGHIGASEREPAGYERRVITFFDSALGR